MRNQKRKPIDGRALRRPRLAERSAACGLERGGQGAAERDPRHDRADGARGRIHGADPAVDRTAVRRRDPLDPAVDHGQCVHRDGPVQGLCTDQFRLGLSGLACAIGVARRAGCHADDRRADRAAAVVRCGADQCSSRSACFQRPSRGWSIGGGLDVDRRRRGHHGRLRARGCQWRTRLRLSHRLWLLHVYSQCSGDGVAAVARRHRCGQCPA